MKGKVVLFTAASPDAGGGSTNLRSILPFLDRDVTWAYTHDAAAKQPGSVRVGAPLMGGSAVRDVIETTALWTGLKTPRFRALMSALLALDARAYWVVGHYEGTLVARELLARGKRVHLTLQDDQPDAVFARSRRYRHLAPVATRVFHDVIRRATSVDVTSDGMQRYYRRLVGREAFVIHPYAAPPPSRPLPSRDARALVVGHVGTVYSVPQWHGFCEALIDAAKAEGLTPRMIMAGLAPRYQAAAKAYPDVIETTGVLAEAELVAKMEACDLLYAQYPFDRASAVFRTTSLPTKLSTYVQSRRPILAETPPGSTLAELVDGYALGRVIDSLDRARLSEAIRALRSAPFDERASRRARDEVYGDRNWRVMQDAIDRLLA